MAPERKLEAPAHLPDREVVRQAAEGLIRKGERRRAWFETLIRIPPFATVSALIISDRRGPSRERRAAWSSAVDEAMERMSQEEIAVVRRDGTLPSWFEGHVNERALVWLELILQRGGLG